MPPLDAVPPLALFTGLMLALSLQALTASGHFPREHRSPALASGFGAALLYGAIVLAALCLIAGMAAAWRLIPWYAAVIGGGLAILLAPLVLQKFSDRFVDGRAALFTFGGIALALTLSMMLMLART